MKFINSENSTHNNIVQARYIDFRVFVYADPTFKVTKSYSEDHEQYAPPNRLDVGNGEAENESPDHAQDELQVSIDNI